MNISFLENALSILDIIELLRIHNILDNLKYNYGDATLILYLIILEIAIQKAKKINLFNHIQNIIKNNMCLKLFLIITEILIPISLVVESLQVFNYSPRINDQIKQKKKIILSSFLHF